MGGSPPMRRYRNSREKYRARTLCGPQHEPDKRIQAPSRFNFEVEARPLIPACLVRHRRQFQPTAARQRAFDEQQRFSGWTPDASRPPGSLRPLRLQFGRQPSCGLPVPLAIDEGSRAEEQVDAELPRPRGPIRVSVLHSPFFASYRHGRRPLRGPPPVAPELQPRNGLTGRVSIPV